MKRKRLIFSWHHYLGLVPGFFFLLMSITGSILAFSDEIEEGLIHRYKSLPGASASTSIEPSLQTVMKKFPDHEIRLYDLAQENEAFVFELRKKENSKKVFVDPGNANIIHVIEDGNSLVHRKLLLLHYTLFSGTPGKIIVFSVGVLFLGAIITGFLLYRRSILKTIRFKSKISLKSKRAFYSSLHRVTGVWTLLFNLLIVLSGLLLSGQISLNAIKGIPAATSNSVAEIASVDNMRSTLKDLYPNFEVHMIRIRPGSPNVQFSGRFASDPFYYGNYYSWFIFDGEGKIEKSQLLSKQSTGKKLLAFSGPLHFGNYGGLVVKILYSFFGIMPGILSITGFILWRIRRSKHFFLR